MGTLSHQKASQHADGRGLTLARAGAQTWALEFQVLGFSPTYRNLHQLLKSALLAGLADGPAFGGRCLKRDPTKTARWPRRQGETTVIFTPPPEMVPLLQLNRSLFTSI